MKKSTLSILKNTARISMIAGMVITGITGCKKEFVAADTATAANASAATAASQPNIILFIGDDFGYELPQFTGGQSYSTPSLNFMARNGIQFSNAFNHPDGFPTRLMTMTGKYNFRNYIRWGYLPESEMTIGNMLKDAGYNTCYVGKWQMNGGEPRILSAGFDNYRVFLPRGVGQRDGRYKNPKLFEDGAYLPAEQVEGKYSEDMFVEYLANFIEQNDPSKPFFAIYAHLLPARQWVPTPDDPEFATWDPSLDGVNEDIKYFPSMVKYMDKMIGKIMQKVRAEGQENNTIFMFMSDNATDTRVTSNWRGKSVEGTKTTTTRAGTTNPFVAYGPGRILSGAKTGTLVDYTDMLPSLAAMAGIPVPNNYGILDGVNFYDNMTGTPGQDREWVFFHWDNNPDDGNAVPLERFINDTNYKLYDTVGVGNGKFYKIKSDYYETKPIPDDQLTPEEQQIKQNFRDILNTMHN